MSYARQIWSLQISAPWVLSWGIVGMSSLVPKKKRNRTPSVSLERQASQVLETRHRWCSVPFASWLLYERKQIYFFLFLLGLEIWFNKQYHTPYSILHRLLEEEIVNHLSDDDDDVILRTEKSCIHSIVVLADNIFCSSRWHYYY